jgi:hypothetical protein
MIFEKISSSKPIMIAIDFEKVLSHADSNSVFAAAAAPMSPRLHREHSLSAASHPTRVVLSVAKHRNWIARENRATPP